MKKLICVTVMLLVTLTIGAIESIISTKYYEKMCDELIAIDKILVEENVAEDKAFVTKKMNTLRENWNKNQKYAMAFSNHAVIRTLDEKLVCIVAWIEKEKFDNAHEFCVTAIELIKDIVDDTHLTIENFL